MSPWLLLFVVPVAIVSIDAVSQARFRSRCDRREAMWRAIEKGIRRGEDVRELVRRHYKPF